MTRIGIVPQVSGVGGMVSFRAKFSAGLTARGFEVSSNPQDADAVLVIGGTRDLLSLWRAKRRGVRIVQRLNGINWLHRKIRTGWRHYLRAEIGNWILQFIRARLADHIVYQSEFSQQWWQRIYGAQKGSQSITLNAVDLQGYTPEAASVKFNSDSQSAYRVLLVEGSLMGGYEMGLESAIGLVERLNDAHRHSLGEVPVELVVVGRVSEALKADWTQRTDIPLVWAGLLPPEKIPSMYHSADLLFSSDINAACPNSVIEALACGTPVLAFDTGALGELVSEEAGRIIPYGGDPWNLDPPDVDGLADAAVEILLGQEHFRPGARAHAEEFLGLDEMVDGYLAALFPGTSALN
ncbi:MAG: glycosyltransferase family 4 protein [Chloroflexota bacterium]